MINDNKIYLTRLANIMGLDKNNSQHSVALIDALSGIIDGNDFIDYCHKKKEGVTYSTKPERLMTIASRYKKEENGINKVQIQSFVVRLMEKVNESYAFIKTNQEDLYRGVVGLKVEGARYFMDKEIKLINHIGGVQSLINKYELNILEEAFYKGCVDLIHKASNNDQLTDGQKRVKALIGGAS